MKPNFYPILRACFFLSLFCLLVQQKVFSQCNCSPGVPATPITYYVVLDTTDAPSAIISFPRFNTDIGDLRCVVFEDTLSLVSISNVTNTASVGVIYKFLLSVSNEFNGPGISVSESETKIYGEDFLTAKGTVGDSISYGPDTLFKASAHQTSASNTVGYLGASGNVDFVYTVNGGLISTKGGISYKYQIVSKYWGTFRLTYYWCPNELLANNIQRFSVFQKNGSIMLSWFGQNETTETRYEVEVSSDGKNFQQYKTLSGSASSQSAFELAYNSELVNSNKLYFRIKRIDANGKVSYTSIKSIMTGTGSLAVTPFPNPTTNTVRLDFDRAIRGDVDVELINTLGQIVFSNQYKLKDQPSLQVNWRVKPPKGIYYLRATDKTQQKQYTTRLIIN